MANILDYIDWRGDLSFEVSPFCTIDALILAQLSYVPFEGIIEERFGRPVPLTVAAMRFDPEKVPEKLRIISFKEDCELIEKLKGTVRFGNIMLDGYISETSGGQGKQFAALTCILPDGRRFVSFRGTDDTIVGWKEDFNFSYLNETPSQKRAVSYLNDNLSDSEYRLILGGHSKGGNLSVYSAMKCNDGIRSRIDRIFDLDGPGFRDETASSEEYRRIIGRIESIIPESSLVGQLLTANVHHSIVRSSASGIGQHSIYSWQLKGTRLEQAQELSTTGSIINKTMSSWLSSMDDESRRMLVKAIFDVLEAPEAETFSELSRSRFHSYGAVLGALRRLAPEQQKVLIAAFKRLAKSGRNALFSELSESTSMLIEEHRSRGQTEG